MRHLSKIGRKIFIIQKSGPLTAYSLQDNRWMSNKSKNAHTFSCKPKYTGNPFLSRQALRAMPVTVKGTNLTNSYKLREDLTYPLNISVSWGCCENKPWLHQFLQFLYGHIVTVYFPRFVLQNEHNDIYPQQALSGQTSVRIVQLVVLLQQEQ